MRPKLTNSGSVSRGFANVLSPPLRQFVANVTSFATRPTPHPAAAATLTPELMADTLPKFDAPPVVETLISVQFNPLPNFTAAMTGWFWKSYLDDAGLGKWTKTQEAPPLQDQFEQFGPDGGWAIQGLQFLAGTLLSGKFFGPRMQ